MNTLYQRLFSAYSDYNDDIILSYNIQLYLSDLEFAFDKIERDDLVRWSEGHENDLIMRKRIRTLKSNHDKYLKTFAKQNLTFQKYMDEKLFLETYNGFEYFFSNLLAAIFTTCPNILLTHYGDHKYDAEELWDIADGDTLKTYIIDGKIRQIMSQTNIKKILEGVFQKIGLAAKLPKQHTKDLLFCSILRNTLTHDRGIMSRQTLNSMKKFEIIAALKEGESVVDFVHDSEPILTNKIRAAAKAIYEILLKYSPQIEKYSKSLTS